MSEKKNTSGFTQYRFRIDAYSPDTMPMARLAEYMAQLAELLGEPSSVHFERLEMGSTVLVHKVEREAVPKVSARALGVARGEGPREAVRAYASINRLLRDDNRTRKLVVGRTRARTVLEFPGAAEGEEPFPSVRQHGSLDGVVIRVGGTDATVPVWLESEGRQIAGCYADRATAKKLAHNLFEPVRLFGRGRWSRDAVGLWILIEFRIEGFEVLKDVPLRKAVAQLRSIDAGWDDDAYGKLRLIRHGPAPKKKRNGGV